jgi:hypothetical protein
LSQMNLTLTLTPYFDSDPFIYVRVCLTTSLFPSGFPTEIVYIFHIS